METNRHISRETDKALPDSRIKEFYKKLSNTFLKVKEKTGNCTLHFFNIAGFSICLQFAGSALKSKIIPAFEHLEGPRTDSPDITVSIWDTVSTSIRLSAPEWDEKETLHNELLPGYTNPRFKTTFNPDRKILNAVDLDLGQAFFWIKDAVDFPLYESGAPLKTILQFWMKKHGLHFVHAAAVGISGTGALIVGMGGSGKSTTALACLDKGLFFAGDDYVLLSGAPDSFVHPLYCTAKIGTGHTKQLFLESSNIKKIKILESSKSESADNMDQSKHCFFLYKQYSKLIGKGFRISAILIPSISGNIDTKIEPADSKAGMMALAPSTLLQLTGSGASSFRFLAEFTKQVPAYSLKLGSDLNLVGETVSGFLKALSDE